MKLVVIDPGHGGKDPGAVGNGLQEKDVALSIALKTDWYLNNYYKVNTLVTRYTDKDLSLQDRSKISNNKNADLFFSVHCNAFDGNAYGYEDYTYLTVGQATKSIRETFHNKVTEVLNKYNIRNRGMKTKNLAVLRETKASAILAETLFIDNVSDSNLLKNPSFIEDVARAYADGVASALNLEKKK
ncbi:N-acetylmuramoyl-L-alanine amidase [Gottschalkia purinilytica]|uniref:N-acetylmuramoyl-L-alanine amidase n=1 Tax=Gottschalkia purinilytica TaxID=1503 RepID=A0A0L0WB62_GOTPU|nr:N-acetylmuramoyl-L-alanine amidase [Gottschalkia purinilytica]KNF08570.1 N-acetylmuramoyl-L-alanine amidase [Gottschalkia purinilytica]